MDNDAHKLILAALVARYPCKDRFYILGPTRFDLKPHFS